MSLIQKMRDKWKLRRERKGVGKLMPGPVGEPEPEPASPPLIETQWGRVSESARHRAALNMRADLQLRAEIEKMLAGQLYGGDLEKGIQESMRRYPEAYIQAESLPE